MGNVPAHPATPATHFVADLVIGDLIGDNDGMSLHGEIAYLIRQPLCLACGGRHRC